MIHRDLKPGNIFLDSETNIRLGDFGLATTRKRASNEAETLGENAIEDISHLLSEPHSLNGTHSNKSHTVDASITGGVGTRFYCAPEQERTNYDTKADIFSLGIVLFEMFHPPFSTMMHRAETLEKLRGKLDYLDQDVSKF